MLSDLTQATAVDTREWEKGSRPAARHPSCRQHVGGQAKLHVAVDLQLARPQRIVTAGLGRTNAKPPRTRMSPA